MAKHVGAWAHAEHGLGMHVYLPANRDAPTNMINNALSVGSLHKLRFAQDLILYNLELDDEIEGFDGQAHITTWQEDPIWQKTREVVEQLTATRDWSEAFFATAVVFEPLVGELFRSSFVMQVAALQVDFVTPSLFGSAESDTTREQRGARRLFAMLANDPEHGAENKQTMQGWLEKWTPCASRPRARCSRSGRSPPRRRSRSRTRWSARSTASKTCSRTSDSRPPRRLNNGRQRPVQGRPHLVQPRRGDADGRPGRPHGRRRHARAATSPSRSCRR